MKKGLSLFLAISLLVLHMVCFGSVFAAGENTEIPVYLSDLTPASVQTGWGDLHKDENLEGAVLSLNNAGASLRTRRVRSELRYLGLRCDRIQGGARYG